MPIESRVHQCGCYCLIVIGFCVANHLNSVLHALTSCTTDTRVTEIFVIVLYLLCSDGKVGCVILIDLICTLPSQDPNTKERKWSGHETIPYPLGNRQKPFFLIKAAC